MSTYKPIMSEWNWGRDINGYYGTRVFVTSTDADAIALPDLGDSWSTALPTLTVKKWDVKYINDNPNCPQRIVVSYDSYYVANPEYDESGGGGTNNSDLLPISIDMAPDYDTYNNPADSTSTKYWYWADGVAVPPAVAPKRATGVTLFRLLPQESFIISRYVFGTNLVAYHNIAKNTVGKVNNGLWMGLDIGTVRFDGVQFEEIRNDRKGTQRKWLAKLKFSAKLKSGDTWNKLYNPETNTYDEMLFYSGVGANGAKMYEEANLVTLFTFGAAALSASPVVPTATYTPIGGPVTGMT